MKENNADAWIIAFAKAHGHTIVTNEKFQLKIRDKISIPNACKYYNIPYIDLFNMLKRLGFKM